MIRLAKKAREQTYSVNVVHESGEQLFPVTTGAGKEDASSLVEPSILMKKEKVSR